MRRLGTVLDGKWTLDRLLGIGGMAAVYAATHRNGARAAIKLFPFSVTTSPEFAERILREGMLANKIGHSAVVRVLDDHLDREREHAYLVMELLEGETARQRVERLGPMSPVEAVDFCIELLDCLAIAHEKGVVHRDIKPENLFLTEDGHLKVLDFGVARAIDNTSSTVTRTGAMLGTPAYMSPEQARGKPSEISPRSDIYSSGATLLFLLTGEFVHDGESAQEIMVRAAWTPAHKTSERGLGLPISLADVIDKACAFDPNDRYQTAAGMRRALEAARTTLSRDVETTGPIIRVRPPQIALTPTAPLPLRITRSNEETVMDRAAAEIPSQPLPSRRGPLVIAVSAAIVALASFLLFSSRDPGEPEHAAGAPVEKPAAPVAKAPLAAGAPANQEAARAPAAPEIVPDSQPKIAATIAKPVPHAAIKKAPLKPPAKAAPLPASAAPSRAPAPVSRLSPSSGSPERDIGY